MQFFYPSFLRVNASSRKPIALIFSLFFFSLVLQAQNTTTHALDFDGSNDKVTIPDNNSLDMTRNYTLEAWVYPTQFIHMGGIIDKYQTVNANGYLLRLDGTSGKVMFDARVSVNNVLTLNNWHHIVGVDDNGTKRLYINGVEVALGTANYTVVANGDPIGIGVDFNDNSRLFKGKIDEVRIWNIARTATQISESMNRMMEGNETGLVAYYRFDQGTAGGANTALTTLTNMATATGSTLNGTLSGFSLNNTATSNWVTGYSSFQPLVSTTTASSVAGTSAGSGGNVVHEGGTSVTRGVVWSTTAGPTVSLSTKTNNGTGTGSFTSSITGLSPNTTYYYRAYATNSNGTTYGSELSFTTPQVAPSISYPSASYTFSAGSAITPVPLTNSGGLPDIAQVSTLAGGAWGFSDGFGTAAKFQNPRGLAVDGSGNVFVAELASIRKIDPLGNVTTLAGNGTTGFADGSGSSARFNSPYGISVDASGNVYVVDALNQRIRKIDLSATVSTFAGTGTIGEQNGPGSSASFFDPLGLTIDPAGNLYTTEFNRHRIRKIDPSANVTTFAGSSYPSPISNGPAASATFKNPFAIATDGSGNFYVADYGNHLIRKISAAGQVSTYAGTGVSSSVNGSASTATFSLPFGVAVDSRGNIYVTEEGKNTIRKIDLSGQVTTFAGAQTTGTTDGSVSNARFNFPYGLAVDASDNIYVADLSNQRIRKISRYRIEPALPAGMYFNTQTGQITGTPTASQAPRTYTIFALNSAGSATTQITIAVSGPPTVTTQAAINVTGNSAKLNATVNANGGNTTALSIKYSIVEADVNAGNGTVATINPASVSGNSNTAITADITGLSANTTYYFRVSATNASGTANGTTLSFTTGPAAPIISYGTSSVTVGVGTAITPLTVTNTGGQIDPMIVSTLAGNGNYGYADGAGSSAMFRFPYDLTVDPSGNVFVADAYNSRIRKIDLSGNVSTWAGGTAGFADGQGTAASFSGPTGIESDASGNLYVSDGNNFRIRKITSSGLVSTLAGSGSRGSANGPGNTATLNYLLKPLYTSGDKLLVGDGTQIRQIDLSDNSFPVSNYAGSTRGYADGDRLTAAKFLVPWGMAVDGSGNIFVADLGSSRIRKIVPSTGMVSTIAGTGRNGSADGPATAASFTAPSDLVADATGNLYVVDAGNNRIRKIDASGNVTTLAGSSAGFSDGIASNAKFNFPFAIDIDSHGNLYVADLGNQSIRRISRFSISPALPAGLSFNSATGEITGIPTVLSPATTYTVSTANPGGTSTTTFTLEVSSSLLTTDVTAITETTASSGGTVDNSFSGVTARGVIWSTSVNPDITLSTKTSDGTGTGIFTSSITGLSANTTYYVRSYVVHSGGTDYGSQKTFKTNQLGTFADITKTFGDANFTLTTPAAVSTGAFSYASSDPAVATISGSTVTITGVGTATIMATQAAAGAYASITKNLTLTVNKATPIITLNVPSTAPLNTVTGANTITVSGTSSDGQTVTLTIVSGGASGTLTATGTPGEYTLSNVSSTGTITFQGAVAGNTNYNAATKQAALDVQKSNQTITFNALSPVTFVNGLTQALSANSSSNLAVSYTVVSGPASVAGSTLTITGPGSIVIKASQAGNGTYNPAPDVERTLVVNTGAPVVSSFMPASAREGDVVTITGQYFDNVSAVSFGGTAATSFIVVNSTTITAVVGTGATGSVSVTTTGGTHSRGGFRYKVMWTGATNAFNRAANWSGSRVPQTDDDIVFDPNAASDLELDGSKTVGNVDFNGSGRSLKLGAHNLIVKGNVTMPGNITGSGKIIMRGSGAQTITGGGRIPDLEIDNAAGVSIDASGDELEVTGVLRSTAGSLNANGKLRLTSSSGGTARVGVVSGSITGNVIAERYVQRNNNADGTGRAWRLVSIPVSGSGTLRDFFMNGRNGQDLTNATVVSGEDMNAGTPIVGHNYASAAAATAAGFDWIGVANMVSSLRFYSGDAGGGSFNSSQVPNLSTTYAAADQGYMVFTRGDRKLTFPDANSSSATTFRSTGTLKTGTQQVSVAPASTSKYTLVGNPYMSVLDLAAFYTTNSAVINPSFWIWEPNIAGTHKQGEYINVYKSGTEWVTNTGTYINPQLIESGVAFFVEPVSSLATATNITIMETHKSSETSAGLAPLSTEPKDDRGRLFVKLQRADARGERQLIDGVALEFHKDLKETLGDAIDHEKLRNGISRGSLWVTNSGKSLSSEGRPWPALDSRKSIPLQMSNIGNQTLIVSLDPRGMNKPGLKAWLKDNSLNTQQEIDLSKVNEFDFIGTGSSAKDSTRFEIVYAQQPLPPVKFINTSAKKVASGVELTWETPLDAGASYEIVRSADLESFATIHKQASNGKVSNSYSFIDTKPHPVVNYYRVVSKNATGQLWMSNWMRVNMSMKAGDWKLYPNPSAETKLQLELAEIASGTYTVSVFDQQGRQVDQQRIEHGGGNRVHGLILPKRLTTGIYILQVTNARGEIEQTMKWMRE